VPTSGAAGTTGQGFAGGSGAVGGTPGGGGGGGGGAGAAGADASGLYGGNGGDGIQSAIIGVTTFYGGGGGGGPSNYTTFTSAGGAGGGGAGKLNAGDSGTNGLGGGGGGAGFSTTAQGGAGGSGVVFVRYFGAPAATGGTITSGSGSATGYTIHEFSTVGSSTFTLTAPITTTLSGNLSGTGGFTFDSATTLVLTGSNSYSGGTVISNGTLRVGNGGGTGSLGIGDITNNASLIVDRSGSLAIPGVISGTGSLTKQAAGTLTLTGSNTYSGATMIAAGTLQVGNGGTAGELGGTGSIGNAGTLAFDRSDAVALYRAITGTGSLVQQGTGNLILSASSNYTGPTTVSAGRLSVNGVLGTSPVAVLAAAELGGSGSIAGPVSIAGGGTLSPGNSIASLATGTATFAAGATFEYEVDSSDLGALGTAADLLVVNGDLNLDPGNGTLLTFLDLAPTPQYFSEDTTIFALINYSGSWNGGLFTYGSNVLSDGERFMVGSQQWEIDYDRTSTTGLANFTGDYVSGSFVAITAVPEPSTLLLAGLACGGYVVFRRCRRA
jgi:autotransporter-associated beta strand protein